MILFLFFIIYLLSYSVDNVNHRDFLIMYAWLNNFCKILRLIIIIIIVIKYMYCFPTLDKIIDNRELLKSGFLFHAIKMH